MSEAFEAGPVDMTSFGTIGAPIIHAMSYEQADDGRGVKIVYRATRSDGVVATFETGSFLDKGGGEIDVDKHDICVSTAGGCTRSCRMCSVPNATLGFERLLTEDEIVAQAIHAAGLRNPTNTIPNVVGMMGNGEPPDNPSLFPAIKRLAQMRREDGTPFVDRFTISTIGEHTKGIISLADKCAELDATIRLQFSLHAVDETKRRLLVPGKAPMSKILQAVDYWTVKTGEPVKHNVVLMDGTGPYAGFSNATKDDARKLAAHLLAPSSAPEGNLAIPRRLKLSAFNPIPGIFFTRPTEEARAEFVDVLRQEGIQEIKTFQGSGVDIDPISGAGGFACGQLRSTTARQMLPLTPKS